MFNSVSNHILGNELNNTPDKSIQTEAHDIPLTEFSWSADLVSEMMMKVSGGSESGNALNGLVQLGFELSRGSRTLGGNLLFIKGNDLSEFTGDGFGVSNIYGHNGIRLFELWFEQSLLGDRANIRLGNLAADGEFSVNELSGLFLNGSFGWPAHIAANTINSGPAYPVAALGVRFKYEDDDDWYVQTAVLDGDPCVTMI